MGRRRKDLKGKKYGKLTLLEYVRPGGSDGAVWLAECECGRIQEVVGNRVAYGRKTQCDNHMKGLGISGNTVITNPIPKGMRDAFRRLIRYCIRNKLAVEITPEKYVAISSGRCALCNAAGARAQLVDPVGVCSASNLLALCEACTTLRGGGTVGKLLEQVIRINANIRARTTY